MALSLMTLSLTVPTHPAAATPGHHQPDHDGEQDQTGRPAGQLRCPGRIGAGEPVRLLHERVADGVTGHHDEQRGNCEHQDEHAVLPRRVRSRVRPPAAFCHQHRGVRLR